MAQAPHRLRELRDKQGFSRTRLAKLAHTSPGQITKLERGERKLTQHWMERLAPPLQVRPQDFLPQAGASEAPPGTAGIPEIEVRAAAGGGAVVQAEGERGRWFFPDPWVRYELRSSPSDLRIIAIDGDSMEPDLRAGDMVMVDVNRRAPSPPGIFILDDGMGLLAKQLEHIPYTDPPKVVITSRNRDYQAYERSAEELSIIGRVVGLVRRL